VLQKNSLKMQGLSLIELMISMVIGLFLVGGLSSIYMNSKTSDKMRAQVSEMEENARTALITMRQIISHAGYPSERAPLPIEKPFYADADDMPNPACRSGGTDNTVITNRYIKNKKTANAAVAKRDTMVVVSMLDSPSNASVGASANITEDCGGAAVEAQCSSDPVEGIYNNSQARVYNYLYINTPSGRRALTCMGSLGDSQPIAENIESLQFLYGVSKGEDSLVYRNAKDVDDNNEWGNVIIVQVGILVRSEKEVLQKEASKVFLILDEEITTPKDKRIYRAYTTTIVLPNVSISL